MATRVTQLGNEVAGLPSTTTTRVTELGVETAGTKTPTTRVTQVGVETAGTVGNSATRVTQLGVEVVRPNNNVSVVTQLGTEIAGTGVTDTRVTQLGIEYVMENITTIGTAVTQLGVEVAGADTPNTLVTQLGIEYVDRNADVIVYHTDSLVNTSTLGTGFVVHETVKCYASLINTSQFGAGTIVWDNSVNGINLRVLMNGVDITPYIMEGTLEVQQQLNFQAGARFTLWDETFTLVPSAGIRGRRIHIYYYDAGITDIVAGTNQWVLIFAGNIASYKTTREPGDYATTGTHGARHEVTCEDFAKAFSRRLVNRTYSAEAYGTLRKVLKDIQEQYLLSEGITWLDQGEPDVTVDDMVFRYRSIVDVFDELASATGKNWYVDFQGTLRFSDNPTATSIAPFNMVETDNLQNWRNAEVQRTNGLYRNVQYVEATISQSTIIEATAMVAPTNETVPPYPYQRYWSGDLFRDQTYFAKVSRIVDVKMDSVSVPWFIQDIPGIQTGTTPPANWRFMVVDASSIELIYNYPQFGTAPAGTVVEVTFELKQTVPAPVCVKNQPEIDAKRALEGGSGIYEAVEVVQDIEDRESLTQLANNLLERFSTDGFEVSQVEFIQFGLMPGQTITVSAPSRGVPTGTSMTVEGTTYKDVGKRFLLTGARLSTAVQQRDALTSMRRLIYKINKRPARAQLPITFVLGIPNPGDTPPDLIVASNVTNVYILKQAFTCKDISVYLKTPPQGSSAIFDIKCNGTSIMDSAKIAYTTSGGTQRFVNFAAAPQTLPKDGSITIDIVQVGSSIPGTEATLILNGWV